MLVLSMMVQFVLFLVSFLVGSFVRPFHLQTVLASDAVHTRVFVWDGLLMMLMLYLLVLVLEAALRRLRGAAGWSTVAVVLAAVVGLAMKFGFVSVDR